MWAKVFKNEPSKICGRQHLKKFEVTYGHFKIFKGCLSQILLGPFLNTSSHILSAEGFSEQDLL